MTQAVSDAAAGIDAVDTPTGATPAPKPPTAAAAAPAAAAKAHMRQAMLQGPILATLVRLAVPTTAVILVQTLVGVAETFFVSFLGKSALGGVALVFPVLMLVTMMCSGGIGGGVSAAVARAIGAGRRDDADALVLHSLVISAVCGAGFTIAALLLGPAIYRALGGEGATLDAAVTYSNFIFAAAVPLWIVNLFSAALRGAGNVRIPAIVNFIAAAVLIVLSPALIFGVGPIPGFGIAGAGLAVTAYYVVAAVVLIRYMMSGRAVLVLKRARLEARLFRDILRVGLIAALATAQFNLTIVLITGTVGLFGTEALAGYGMASRLDYVLIPLIFGLGTATITMVGMCVGAGNMARARRIAWTGALLSAGITEAIGLAAAAAPGAWIGLFSSDPAVLATGTLYLHIVAPVYGAVGLGMLLFFASQGAGRVLWPFFAGTLRLAIVAVAGWLAVAEYGFGLPALFGVAAVAALIFAAINVSVTLSSSWRQGAAPAAAVRKAA